MRKRYCVKVEINNNEVHNASYCSLFDIATDLGLTYDAVASISCGRSKLYTGEGFKYNPKIVIEKILVNNIDNAEESKKTIGKKESTKEG
tara:strand:+ start:62 stop:331 length:270 start_codon:yes stop_codon:yes gene_type:complete